MTALEPAGPVTERLRVQGRDRTLTVSRRSGAPSDAAPVILALHGSNQNAATFRAFLGGAFDRFATEDGAVVAYLDGHKGHWNDARLSNRFAGRIEGYDDVAFVRAALDLLVQRYHADPARAYAVGYSNGGQMVIRLVHEIPELLAGAAILSATQPAPENFAPDVTQDRPLPVLLLHGTKDPLVPYSGGQASLWGFRPRGPGLSAPDTAAYYADRNGIIDEPTTRRVTRPGRRGAGYVTRTDYRQAGHHPVTLFTVHGGGHSVPGSKKAPFLMGRTNRDLDTVAAVSGFFGLRTPS